MPLTNNLLDQIESIHDDAMRALPRIKLLNDLELDELKMLVVGTAGLIGSCEAHGVEIPRDITRLYRRCLSYEMRMAAGDHADSIVNEAETARRAIAAHDRTAICDVCWNREQDGGTPEELVDFVAENWLESWDGYLV